MKLSARAATVNRFAPYALVAAIALIVVAMQWLARRLDRETGEGN